MATFFKYRQIGGKKNNSYLKDIIENEELYCSLYDKLNDPLELYFCSEEKISNRDINRIIGSKKRRYLCSFSGEKTAYHDNIMWAMYANNHDGCCIEFEIIDENVPKKVKYNTKIPKYDKQKDKSIDSFIDNKLFYHKTLPWKHEDEWRVCINSVERPKLKIRIRKIVFGAKVPTRRYNYWKDFIQSKLGNEIKIYKMKPENLDFGNGKYVKIEE